MKSAYVYRIGNSRAIFWEYPEVFSRGQPSTRQIYEAAIPVEFALKYRLMKTTVKRRISDQIAAVHSRTLFHPGVTLSGRVP
jgi:hypothetical protein